MQNIADGFWWHTKSCIEENCQIFVKYQKFASCFFPFLFSLLFNTFYAAFTQKSADDADADADVAGTAFL